MISGQVADTLGRQVDDLYAPLAHEAGDAEYMTIRESCDVHEIGDLWGNPLTTGEFRGIGRLMHRLSMFYGVPVRKAVGEKGYVVNDYRESPLHFWMRLREAHRLCHTDEDFVKLFASRDFFL